jgi:hypothetical protein
MSNYLAIATVTATLQKILQSVVQEDVEGSRITTIRPDGLGRGTPETGVNLYLYQVTPVNWRNADLPTRRTTGEVVKRPQIALDLNYILTFYGNEVELEPQRLLGSVVRTLHARPVLTQEIIEDTIADSTFRYLRESNLFQQVELVKLMPLHLSTEDLSKIWSVFFQTPYALSIAYQATAVLIESEETPRRALPVREPKIQIGPLRPRIERLFSLDELTKVWHSSPDRPILANSTLQIQGRSLGGDMTYIRVGSLESLPQEVTDRQITFHLASLSEGALRAGIQSLQVIHRNRQDGDRLVESNVFPFVLAPILEDIQVTSPQGRDDEPQALELTLVVRPRIGKNQRVILLLNQIATANPADYSIKMPPCQENAERITVQLSNIKAGEYLARIQVDGVESLLTVDSNRESPTFEQYIAPKIVIS